MVGVADERGALTVPEWLTAWPRLLPGLMPETTRSGKVSAKTSSKAQNTLSAGGTRRHRPHVRFGTGDCQVTRYRDLTANVESLTMVYDAGQNSAANHELVEHSGIGFVGSLPPSDHHNLLAIPTTDYQPVDPDGYPALRCVDTRVTALGVTRRAVLTHSPALHAAQSRGLDQTLAKARRRLVDLQARLARGKTRRDRAAVQADIDAICTTRWVGQIIKPALTGDTPTLLRLTWRTDARARTRLENKLFGKRILFTNQDDWTTAEVVAAYRAQSEVESGFRQMKDPHVVSFGPMHHWTDSKIRVHVFYCVLALTIAHLMRREAEHAGLHLSVRELLTTLAGIEETVLLYHDGGKGRPAHAACSPTQPRPSNAWPTCSPSTATHPPADPAPTQLT